MTHPPLIEGRADAVGDAAVGPGYKWAVVGMLWFICFFNYADRQAISAVLPLLEKEYGFDDEQLGLIGSAFAWVYAATAPMAGQVGDRWPRKFVILSGLYVWSIITGFTALCTKVWQFVLVRGAEGLGETFYMPASMSLISDYHSRRTRSRAMGLHQTSVYAGTVGGSVLAGWMGQHWGWWSSFVLLGILGVVLGLVLARFIREPARDEAERAERRSAPCETGNKDSQADASPGIGYGQFLADLFATPTAVTLIVVFFGANLVALVFLVWMPKFLHDKFDMNLAVAGFSATFFIQFASAVGALVGGIWADRLRRRLPGGRMVVQSIGLFAGAPFIFLCGWTQNTSLLVVAMTCFGFCKGLYDANIWASLYDVVPSERRASAVGLMNMIGWLGGAIGSWAVGAVSKREIMTISQAISSTGAVYAAVALIILFAALAFAPRDTRRAQLVESPRAET